MTRRGCPHRHGPRMLDRAQLLARSRMLVRAQVLTSALPLVAVLLAATAWATVPGMLPVAPAAMPLSAPTATCRNGFLEVRGTELVRLDDTTGRYTTVAHLATTVNALAYSVAQNLFYGIAGARVVTIDPAGHVIDRGPVPHGTTGAYAGAIAGTTWYVRSGGPLFAISVDSGSPGYLRTLRTVPVTIPGVLGDFDVSPGDGDLYAVATGQPGPGRVVRISTRTGQVSILASPAALPGRNTYGGVVISGGVLTAILNSTGVLYRLHLANPAQVTTASPPGTAPTTAHADAAGCPDAPPPSPSPTPSPKPSLTPSLTPKPSPTPSRKPRPGTHPPRPVLAPVPTSPPPSQPRPPSPKPKPPSPSLKPARHQAPWHPVRRFPLTWSVAVLMIIPAAAAATRVAGHALRRHR